jgi:arginase family enzyme
MVGIRNCSKGVFEEAQARGIEIVTSKDLVFGDPAEVIRKAVPPSDHLYVSIDTDVLDGALVPGTTMPEPFGIDYRTLRTALGEVTKKGSVRGFDLVEMTDLDGGIGSARVTAWALAHFVSAIVEARR